MLINVEKENLVIKSRYTGIKYKVYQMNIEDNKVTDYMILNQGCMELWDVKRFYSLKNTICCPLCSCCKFKNMKGR